MEGGGKERSGPNARKSPKDPVINESSAVEKKPTGNPRKH